MEKIKNFLRPFFPQWAINNFYHLPKAILANIFYGFPSSGMTIIGVTGTDGKTTTVNMVYQILKDAGKKVSMVSTINAVIAGKAYDTGFHVTSPDPFMVQKLLKSAKDHGDEYLVLEVTSHGLDQYRLWGIKFKVGIITNITHEHLDYHRTWKNYFVTKIKILKGVKFAIINQVLKQKIHPYIGVYKLITFGIKEGDFSQKKLGLKLNITGDYNIENALAAMAACVSIGVDQSVATKAVENFAGLTGRMEEIKNNKGIKVIVDFAHTPNGLEQVLKTLKSQTKGKLISLIGCEGYRDVGKRSLMGEIAQKLSDTVIVTAVDPRGEMEIINKQITEGAKKAGAKVGENFYIIDDRQQAINFAIRKLANRGDTVGIFGKGHEKSMNLDGVHEIPWSDQEALRKVLNG